MSANKLREVKIPVFDFYKDKPLLIMIGGYSESRSILYIMYIILLYSSLAYFVAFGAYAALMVAPRKALIMDAIHALSICLFSAGGLTSKVLTSRSLKETSNMINMGIYNYNEEDTDEEEIKMKTAIPDEIRRKTNIFVFIFAGGVALEMIVFPISQLILLEQDDPARFDPIVNAFLPPVFFFYMPFNTQTVIGYLTAYILTIILLVSVYFVTTCMSEVFITCAVQLQYQTRILNRSINNIQKRAFKMYLKNHKIDQNSTAMDDLYENKEFQICLHTCLKANVRHHQALLRFKNALQPFCGAVLLDTVVVALICYAAVLYPILQKLPLNALLSHVVILMTEQTHTFYLCYYGEELMEESTRLFERLYDLPWFHYSKSFNRTLAIMMGYSLKPISIRIFLLEGGACLETYGDVVSAAYKVMSLVRHSDSMKE